MLCIRQRPRSSAKVEKERGLSALRPKVAIVDGSEPAGGWYRERESEDDEPAPHLVVGGLATSVESSPVT